MGCKPEISPEQQAAAAAEDYYRQLVAGDYEQFLAGHAGTDSLPEAYREQLLTAYRQFMAQQEQLHDGIVDVRMNMVKKDTVDQYMSVFLLLCFGDSTQEEIVVPMVETTEGVWKIK